MNYAPTPQKHGSLLQREARFRQLFEDAPVAYHEIDNEGRISGVNRAELAMFGYEASEMLGRHVWEFVIPEEREICRAAVIRKLKREKPLTPGQRHYLRKDGETVFIEFHENLIEGESGEIAGIRAILLNITERKKTEETIRASESRYRALFENVLEGVYRSTTDGKLLNANPALVKMLGFSSEEELVRLDIARDLYVDGSHRIEATRRLERDGEIRNLELLLRRKDGSLLVVLENARAVKDAGGRTEYYEGTLTDVTELVQAKEALTLERDFSSAVIDTAEVLIVVTDPWGRIIRFNRACEQVSGYSFEETQGKPFWDFLIPLDEVDGVKRLFEQIRTERAPAKYENSWLTRTGERRLIAWSNAPMQGRDGEDAFVIATGLDITERRRAEESVRLSEQRYRDLFENASDLVYTHDLRGNFTSVNSACERILGYTRAEALRLNIAEITDPKDLAFVMQKIAIKLGGDQSSTYELEVVAKNGNRISLEVNTRLQYDRGRPVGVHGVARDISERRLAEDKLEGYAHELGEKNRELASALADAKEATETKSRFLATMSHEIRTPMNGVIGMSDLLLSTPLDGEQRDYAQAVKHSAEALLTVINDILDISKIEAGRLKLERVPFELPRVVEEVVELLAPRAGSKQIELVCLVRPEVPREVRGDPGRLRQVLLNLIGNALKFTEHGEVVVRVEVEETLGDRVRVRFVIHDTGIGISASLQTRLFRSFVQGDSSTTRKYGGTGLGLAISRQLVEMMGGEIVVESAPGSGSTFHFTITLEKSGTGDVTRSPVGVFGGLRVLVLVDNAAARSAFHEYLRSWGCRSEERLDAAATLVALRQACVAEDPFRVVMLDVTRDSQDIFELSRRIKDDPTLDRTIRIACSTAPMRADPRLAEAGFQGYLQKPIRPSALYDALLTAVHGQRQPAGQAGAAGAGSEFSPVAEKPQRSVLLAEDNEVNQKIVLRYLQKCGYHADVVATGQQAIDAVRKRRYDLILMDIQMPGVDGLGATRAIRRLEGSKRHTPILAMTANAMAGDREKCLAVGMDDYISKPIRLAELGARLTHWLKAREP